MNTECKECGHILPEGATVCPECGALVNGFTNEASEMQWYEMDILSVAIKPIMRWFDSGQFIRDIACGLLSLAAFSFAAAPAWLSFSAYKYHVLVGDSSSEKSLFITILIILLLFGCFSCSYWQKRSRMIVKLFNPKDEFVGVPMGTYLFQWIGEWLAILAGICGTLMIILSFLNINNDSWAFIFNVASNRNLGFYVIGIGILVAIIFRVGAEGSRALTSIANNTGRQSRNEEVKSLLDTDNSNESFWNIVYALSILLSITFALMAVLQK